jgi:Prenyltransferase and squalene oxidase repeat
MVSGLHVLVLSTLALASGEARSQRQQPAHTERAEPDVARPLRWLLQAQNPDGGWGPEAGAPADVATTSLSGIALLRVGQQGGAGELAGANKRALQYVIRAVERAPAPDAYIQPEGTLPQRKLGRGIDTFLAAQFLGEAVAGLPPGSERDRARAALDLCVAKTQALQQQDGSFAKDGWAPVLSSAFAANGLSVAKDVGAKVKPRTLAAAEEYMLRGYDAEKKEFRTGDSAGVALYQAAGSLDAAARAGKLAEAPAQAARAHLADEAFVRGFGSYGGEEHVSYLLSTEAFAKAGGEEWTRWSKSIRARLAGIQREDGTWRGDHCITSTAFCTAASLITLAIRPGVPAVNRG